MKPNPVEYKTPNSIAAVWSTMLPGLGQLMQGRVIPGVLWAVFVGGGYFAYFWPGLTLHALCILDAAFNKNEGPFLGLNSWAKWLAFAVLIAFLLTYIYYRNTY